MKVACLLINIKLDFHLNNSSFTSPKADENLFSARTGRTPQNAEGLPQTDCRHRAIRNTCSIPAVDIGMPPLDLGALDPNDIIVT